MPVLSSLQDTFATQNTALWLGYGDGNISLVNGCLQIVATTSWSRLITTASYDLTGEQLCIEVPQLPNIGNGGTVATLRLGQSNSGDGDGFSIIWQNGYLVLGEWVGGNHDYTVVTYNITNHRWWRIREAGGTVYWEASADGVAWTILRSKTRAVTTITALYPFLQAAYSGTEPSPGAARFDNLNTPPASNASSGNFFPFLMTTGFGVSSSTPPASVPPTVKLGWMDPRYFVTGTGVQTVSGVSNYFNGQVDSYSLSGAPTGVTINSSTGVISVSTVTAFDWTTVTIRATNSAGYAETAIDLWVFTPTHTINSGVAWSSISPTAGSIVVVRGGTYTSMQNVATWGGSSVSNRTRVVAYPGETVTFNCASLTDYAIETNGANYVELRGFTFTANGGCNFAIWNNSSTGIRVAQCDISGFKMQSIFTGQGSKANAGPWAIEYCRIHDNVRQNNSPVGKMGSGGWASGLGIQYSDGTVVRRNRIYYNAGEGLGFLSSSNFTATENIIHDNFSVNLYMDNSQYGEVHGNIVWSNDSSMYRSGQPAASIRASNEDYNGTPGVHTGGREQATTGINATNNYILSGNSTPAYMAYGGSHDDGGAGTSVFTPNTTFTDIMDVWL